MLSRAHRFHGSKSLRRVYAQGQTVRGPLFAVKTVRNDRRSSYRLAVVVSRKVCKSAVGRNRIRRRLYAAVRELGSATQAPHDIVITVFQESLLETSPSELQKQVKVQLEAAGVLTSVAKSD